MIIKGYAIDIKILSYTAVRDEETGFHGAAKFNETGFSNYCGGFETLEAAQKVYYELGEILNERTYTQIRSR